VKYLLFIAAAVALLAACDSQKNAAAEAERRALEERLAAAEKEKAHLAAEREAEAQKRQAAEQQALKSQLEAAAADRAATAAEATRLEAERQRLQSDAAALKAERAKITDEKNKMAAADSLEAQRAAVEEARARAEEERRKLDVARAKADAERIAAEKATAEAQARAETAKREQEAAMKETTSVFYAALSGTGDWFDTDRYGFVWRPFAAIKDQDWRPYVDGHWIFTDYGWSWFSNESFGWATYHYGRWAKIGGAGWVWVPGSEWAPAWVSWRWHRPREYIGWAPLPPEAKDQKVFGPKVDSQFDIGPGNYTFIAMGDFDAASYKEKVVSSDQNRDILPLTSNITYIAPKAGGGGMVCGGPDVSLINSEIRRLRNDIELKAVPRTGIQLFNAPASTAAPDVMNAGAVMYFAPQLKPLPPVGKPDRIKARLEVKSAERGWNPANPWETDEWKGRLKAEAAATDAAEKAAEKAAANRPPPRTPPVATATPTPTPTPTPKPVVAPPPPQPRSGGLQGSSLQPSSSLFPRR